MMLCPASFSADNCDEMSEKEAKATLERLASVISPQRVQKMRQVLLSCVLCSQNRLKSCHPQADCIANMAGAAAAIATELEEAGKLEDALIFCTRRAKLGDRRHLLHGADKYAVSLVVEHEDWK